MIKKLVFLFLILYPFSGMTAVIIDNTDPGFSTIGTWTSSNSRTGWYGSDYSFSASGTGQNVATWTFNVTAGKYSISAWWSEHANRTDKATYRIKNNDIQVATAIINQQISGGQFNLLVTDLLINSGILTVEIDNNVPGTIGVDGFVVADAVKLEALGDTTSSNINLHWNYNKFYHNKILGYRIYMGNTADALTQKILDIKKADLTIYNEQPLLIEEHFDQDPGTKYAPTNGSWTWVAETKNMHIEAGNEFMLVFEKPVGTTNDMGFSFWPEKSSSDQPSVYSYIKDESIGAYYELRLAGSNGIRYSNWRKVYDQKFGGIDPNGAFPLPRYPQCTISEGQNYCPGFRVFMSWDPETYTTEIAPNGELSVMTASVTGIDVDKKPLDINKLEIIINNQGGWIDDIIIGGNMEVGTKIDLTLPQTPVYFAASVYYQDPNDATKILETAKSIPVKYEPATETKRKPLPIKNMRKTP